MKIRLSVDDGCASDVQVAELATKYKLDCTFYLPVDWHSLAYANGYEPLRYDDALDIAQSFTIGSHTITHRHLTKIPFDEARYEIEQSQEMLEDLFNVDIDTFAPPRGYITPELTELVLEIYESQRLTKGAGLVHIHPDSGANDNQPWRERINDDTKELWMHSWELDKYDLWDELELVLRRLK